MRLSRLLLRVLCCTALCRLVFPDDCEVSAGLKDLIQRILEREPSKRLTLKGIEVSGRHSRTVGKPSLPTSHVAHLTDRRLVLLLCGVQLHPWMASVPGELESERQREKAEAVEHKQST